MLSRKRFSPTHHIPQYSMMLFRAIQTPLLVYFIAAGNFFMFIAAFFFREFEAGINPQVETYFDALWWALCTVTTVGFGDITPVTAEGRIVGIALMVFGIIFYVSTMAILASIITSELAHEVVEADNLTRKDFAAVMDELKKLNESVSELKNKSNKT